MAVEFFVHKMSEHMDSAQIVEWRVREGQPVEQFQVLMVVTTDKAVVEMESPAAGVVTGIRPGAVDGATVPVGETLFYIAAPGESVPELGPLPGYAGPASPRPDAAGPRSDGRQRDEPQLRPARRGGLPSRLVASEAGEPAGGGVRASPAARRVAKELGVDLRTVVGSGPQGRITEEDVRATAKAPELVARVAAEAPSAASESQKPGVRACPERNEVSQETKVAPQFALEMSVDMTNALKLCTDGGDLRVTSLLVKVAAAALRRHPRAAALAAAEQTATSGDRPPAYAGASVGVALATDEGLVAPVIRNANRKTVAEIAAELSALRERARLRRFTAGDLSGASLTVSNLGPLGVERYQAGVRPPQAAVLAAGRIARVPVVLPDDMIAPRPLMTLTLTADSRCLDGVQAARFLADVKDLLEEPYLLLAM